IWLMTSSWPTISFFSSVTMCCRPAFMRSASATSSADARSTVSVFTSPPVGRVLPDPQESMRQSVNEKIHPDLERLVRLVDRLEPGARPLPELRHVGVVPDGYHQPLLRIVVFVDAPEDRRPRVVVLRDLAQRVDLEERVKNWMRDVEVDNL